MMERDDYMVSYWEMVGRVMTISQRARSKIKTEDFVGVPQMLAEGNSLITNHERLYELHGEPLTDLQSQRLLGGIRLHIGRVERLMEASQ